MAIFYANHLLAFPPTLFACWMSVVRLWWQKCECMKNCLQKISIKVLASLTKVHSAIHSFHFSLYLCPPHPFSRWHSNTTSPQSLQHDSHSSNSVKSIMARELYIDSLLVYSIFQPVFILSPSSQRHSPSSDLLTSMSTKIEQMNKGTQNHQTRNSCLCKKNGIAKYLKSLKKNKF